MSDAKAQQEPSREEILASIRRIISEDGEKEGEGAQPQADTMAAEPPSPEPPASEPANEFAGEPAPELAHEPADELEDDVLELTEVVEEEAPPLPADDPMPPFPDEPMIEPEPSPAAAAPQRPFLDDDTLLSPDATRVASDAMSRLLQRPEPPSAPDAGSSGLGAMAVGDGKTVEDIVRELLRPMLRDWLEANLPPMVERIVQREVESIANDVLRR